MRVLLCGMNHRSAPVEVRERFAVEDPRAALEKLRGRSAIAEAVLLSTCNRVEVVVATREPATAEAALRAFFQGEIAGDAPLPGDLEDYLYALRDADAVLHLFRVASSIDSLVVGEAQILGQVKQAFRVAADAGTCGPVLSRLFQAAFAVAKRVRTETAVAERPVSVARVAVELGRQIFESLQGKVALLIGAGEMIEAALVALRHDGLAEVRVANRTRERAAELARRFQGSAHGLGELPGLLAEADVVLSCIGGQRPLLSRGDLAAAMRRRGHRPLFLLDIGVPRNVDPAVHDLPGVYLYDLDDLSGLAEANTRERRREVLRAEALVLEARAEFLAWMQSLAAVPTIRRIRARAESIRRGELERALRRLVLDDRSREAVDALTRAIVNKILHAPVSRLRGLGEDEGGLAHLEAACHLFALDDPNAPGADADHRAEPGRREAAAGRRAGSAGFDPGAALPKAGAGTGAKAGPGDPEPEADRGEGGNGEGR